MRQSGSTITEGGPVIFFLLLNNAGVYTNVRSVQEERMSVLVQTRSERRVEQA